MERAAPNVSCAYQSYDVDSLNPLNDETYSRLYELDWTDDDFRGKTVLDIGCNSGLLSLWALRKGAKSVVAVDVQETVVNFFSGVVESKHLPISVSMRSLTDLHSEDAADVVLFMEVLHWVVSQGMLLRDAIARVALLAKDTLYLETPWSIQEPSIKAQTTLTEKEYSADQILRELSRYFMDVKVVRFMHYFGYGSQSKRILIRARHRRPEASMLAALGDADSLGVSLSLGSNPSVLLESPQGLLVAKTVSPTSWLCAIGDELFTRLFDEIAGLAPSCLVAPLKLESEYRVRTNGTVQMVFPFVGDLMKEPDAISPLGVDEFVEVFKQVRRDLRRVSPELLSALQMSGQFMPPQKLMVEDVDLDELLPVPSSHATTFLDMAGAATPEQFDALQHGDLQGGNIVVGRDGSVKCIDLDNLSLGTAYSDLLMGLVWLGASEELFQSACRSLGEEEGRELRKFDIAVALVGVLNWRAEVSKVPRTPEVREVINAYDRGVKALLAIRPSV